MPCPPMDIAIVFQKISNVWKLYILSLISCNIIDDLKVAAHLEGGVRDLLFFTSNC